MNDTKSQTILSGGGEHSTQSHSPAPSIASVGQYPDFAVSCTISLRNNLNAVLIKF